MRADFRLPTLFSMFCLLAMLGACAGGSGGGAYYGNDGPGPRTADEFVNAPDAVPVDEPIYPPSIRPYRVFGKRYVPLTEREPFFESGVASWYGRNFQGKPTSMGEPYDMYAMTAAHPTLPLPSYVRVTNRVNGRSVIVRVNDRGPFLNDRVIDLSYAAAAKLGYVQNGITAVDLEVVDPVVVASNDRPLRRRALALAEQLRSLERSTRPGATPIPTDPRRIGRTIESRVGENQSLPNVRVASADPDRSGQASDVPFVVRFETLEGIGARAAAPETAAGRATRIDPEPEPARPKGPPLIQERLPSVFLQLAAFGTEQTAADAKLMATEQFLWIGVDMKVVEDRGLHKLQAGPFRDAADAKWAADRIRRESAYSPFYVIRWVLPALPRSKPAFVRRATCGASP